MAANTTSVSAATSAYQAVAEGHTKVHVQVDEGANARVVVATSLPDPDETDYFKLNGGDKALVLDGLNADDNVYVRGERATAGVHAIAYSSDDRTANPPAESVGVAEDGAVATEYGNAAQHSTVLVLEDFAVGLSGDAASLALGALLYTFPEGIIEVESAQLIALGVTAAISVTTDTPEIGLGTTVASGANATLGAVAATAENISEGGDTTNIAPNVAGTATINSTKRPTVASGDDGPLVIGAAAAHTVYLNIADGWANVTAAGAVTVSGTIVINWKKLT